jgi:hypothetical protein
MIIINVSSQQTGEMILKHLPWHNRGKHTCGAY